MLPPALRCPWHTVTPMQGPSPGECSGTPGGTPHAGSSTQRTRQTSCCVANLNFLSLQYRYMIMRTCASPHTSTRLVPAMYSRSIVNSSARARGRADGPTI